MKLELVTLQNFRQYYGKQRVRLATHPQRNVTLIHGINGAGKTSLFLALNWCLYGKNVGTGKDEIKIIDNVGELMSKEAVQQAQVGDEIETLVDVKFIHDGWRYQVRRSLTGIKQSDSTVKFPNLDKFMMMRTGTDGQAERVPNPFGTMNAILPANVREYFLFDGEKIDNFAKPEAATQVKDAIYLVLNIEILERSHRHLTTSAKEYRRQLKQASEGKLRELIEREEKIIEAQEKAEHRQQELAEEKKLAEKKIAEIDERLRDIQDAKSLQERRDRIDQEIEQRQSELKSVVNKLATIATTTPAAFAMLAIDRAIEILEIKREKGEIPSGIRQQFVQDLLAEMVCICGRPFAEHSPEHQHLLQLLESRIPGSIEDDILNTNAFLQTLNTVVPERLDEINNEMQRRTELIHIIESNRAELDDITRQLEGSPVEEISRLEQQRQEFREDIDGYNLDSGALSRDMDRLTKELRDLEKDIAKAEKQEEYQQLLSKKLELAQQSADAINEMYQAFADDMRQRIEMKTKEIFKELVWKESHFQNVELGSDFNLEVIDRYGKPARPELSAGERQVLSLSFIAAMGQVSEEEAPLVMDTPFGRLSSQHRNSITQRLPVLADQLVLFVTDEELHGVAQDNLQLYIGEEYRLNFDRMTSCTKIEKVSK